MSSTHLILITLVSVIGQYVQGQVSYLETPNIPYIRDSGTLIVGGKEVPYGKFSHLCGMRDSNPSSSSFCGGSVISTTHVLTAAHCADYIKTVAIGTHYLSGQKDGVYIKVKNATVHPKYDADASSYDFAILELATPIPASAKVTPVLLARSAVHEAPGLVANVHGWGTTSQGGIQSKVALEVDVALLSNQDCSTKLSGIDTTMICAGGKKGEDSCQGDSGGPLVVYKNDQPPTLVGVVSWGIGCAQANKPGVYARVTQAADFIDTYSRGHVWHY